MLQKIVGLWGKLIAKVNGLAGLAPLAIRLSVGIPFVVTGWGKLHNLDQIIGYFTSLGIPAPQLQAPFVAGLEFFGGIALILGLGSRFFAVPMMTTMVVAILTAKRDKIDDWTDLFDFIEWHYLIFFFVIALIGAGADLARLLDPQEAHSFFSSGSGGPSNSHFHVFFSPALRTISSS